MIFLAISAALLFSAIVVIGGRQGEVQFTTSMRDLQSKVQDWMNDVTTGFPGGTYSRLNCTVSGHSGRPVIQAGSPSSKPECVFLGKAIQFTTDNGAFKEQSHKLFVYSIFGRRAASGSDPDDGSSPLAANLTESLPQPAVDGDADLTEAYDLGGAKVTSITKSDPAPIGNSQMIGFFLSFNNEEGSRKNGNQNLRVYAYRLAGNRLPADDPAGTATKQCLQLSGVPCEVPSPPGGDPNNWPEPLKELDVCFGNDYNNQTAKLIITSTNGLGAATKLEFNTC